LGAEPPAARSQWGSGGEAKRWAIFAIFSIKITHFYAYFAKIAVLKNNPSIKSI